MPTPKVEERSAAHLVGPLISEYQNGHSLPEIARQFGWPISRVRTALLKAGLKLRTPREALILVAPKLSERRKENRSNNHPDNLQLMTRSAHSKLHIHLRRQRGLLKHTEQWKVENSIRMKRLYAEGRHPFVAKNKGT
jgi:hypothetical protein